MTFRPTHTLTIPVRVDEDGNFWIRYGNGEDFYIRGDDLFYTLLEQIPRTFEVNDCVVMRTTRLGDQPFVWTIIGIDDTHVWLRRQSGSSTIYNTARTDALEHAQ
jgi:hypothetical protein